MNNPLVSPGLGVIFWMLVSFGILVFILMKWGWPVVLKALKEREKTIGDQLNAAEQVKREMATLKADNERLLNEAKMQRDEILRNARLAGSTHFMIVVAEGVGSAMEIGKQIHEAIGISPRVTVLGHIQRGGAPNARDRETATRMGYFAVRAFAEGRGNKIKVLKRNAYGYKNFNRFRNRILHIFSHQPA